MNEANAIERLRRFATDPAARGLADDAALFAAAVHSARKRGTLLQMGE